MIRHADMRYLPKAFLHVAGLTAKPTESASSPTPHHVCTNRSLSLDLQTGQNKGDVRIA